MSKYKVLSVRQPYANLICKGKKDVENRSRRTNYRGMLLIHASGKMHDIVDYLRDIPGYMYTGIFSSIRSEADLCDLQQNLNFSAIVGYCTLADCVQNYPSEWAEKGMWHWICKDAVFFKKPIVNVKGKLGIWEWEGEIEK